MNDGDFVKDVKIRFAHCDPAGIVFFPQYFVIMNGFIEDWFDERLGIGFAAYFQQRRLSIPIVKLECEFLAPSRFGEVVALALTVTRIGASSVSLRITGNCGAERRLVCSQVLVTTSLETGKAIRIPDDVRAAMAQHGVNQGSCMAHP